jgi:hypothetical protein
MTRPSTEAAVLYHTATAATAATGTATAAAAGPLPHLLGGDIDVRDLVVLTNDGDMCDDVNG